jgi:hypothetical protein
VRDGILVSGENGRLAAQIIYKKGNVEVAIADGPSYTINSRYEISPVKVCEAEMGEISDAEKRRVDNNTYFCFGNPSLFRYDLFMETAGQKPEVIAEVIPHPWKEENFKVRINENANVLKSLSFCLAYAFMTMKNRK